MANDDTIRTGTVFVVDDDAAVRDSFTTLLEAYGLAVSAYDSIAAFLRGYRPRPRACLILDHHMPTMTGLDFLASPEGRNMTMPAILITGGSDKDVRAQAREIGVFAFLAKPVAGDELMAAIGGALERAESHGNPNGTPRRPTESA
jgi:two-component system, LuxR family, response regulator FixJ